MIRNDKIVKFIILLIVIVCILMLIFIIINLNNNFASKANANEKNNKLNIKENQNIAEDSNNKINDSNVVYSVIDENNETLNNSTENNKNNAIEKTTTREFKNNVAFIGDSRTQAFLMYSGLNEVIDYTNIGLMVDTAISKKFITNNYGEKITILDDLKNRDIDTIYIMLGINELGWVYSSIFINKYEELINKILEIKPNCEIIIQSIIPVTKTKSDNDKIYNNKKIEEYNGLIKEMAERKNIKFIDLLPVLVDKKGNLPENASTDGIHLNKNYCLKWLEVLKNN